MGSHPPRRSYRWSAGHALHVVVVATAVSAGIAPVAFGIAMVGLGLTGGIDAHAMPHRDISVWTLAAIVDVSIVALTVHAESTRLRHGWLGACHLASRAS